jgi:hypothetical protein
MMEWKTHVRAAQYTDKMGFEQFDGRLRNVPSVAVGWEKLVGHSVLFNCCLEFV